MRRRSRAGGKPVKTRRRKALAPKRSEGPRAARRHDPSATGKVTEVGRLRRERDDALEQQTATADVLKVISRSTFDLQTVLDTLTESAARLCRAERSAMRLLRDGLYHHVASYGHLPEYKERVEREPLKPGRAFIASRVALEGKSVHVIDALLDPSPEVVNRARTGDVRTALGVPLLRQGTPIGVLLLQRSIVQPFTDKEIALAETFADQAVIAIENVRLFEAEQQRTRELTELLEQQTATAEVLRVISSSPGDLEPVFAAMLKNAVRICDATFGNIYRWDGDALHIVAAHNTPPAFAEVRRRSPNRPSLKAPVGRMVATKTVIHVTDFAADQGYIEQADPASVAGVELGGTRTALYVPMLKDDELIGAFTLARQEVRPFTDKQIELVTSFANQAVIAIENARLLNELRQSLEQQTATADVLKVISSSSGALDPVFKALLENATRLCGASYGNMWLCEGDAFRSVALHGDLPPIYMERWGTGALFRPEPDVPLAKVAKTRRPFQYPDIRLSEAYLNGNPLALSAVRDADILAVLAVPMLRENDLIGAILIYSKQARPFTDSEIELLENFASQAIIAIANAQLLNELRASLEQQTATGQILSSISSSITNTRPVFDAITGSLLRLFGTRFATVQLLQDGFIHLAAVAGEPGFEGMAKHFPRLMDDNSFSGLAMLAKETFQFAPVVDNPAVSPFGRQTARDFGYNSVIFAPMIRNDKVIGAIGTAHSEFEAIQRQTSCTHQSICRSGGHRNRECASFRRNPRQEPPARGREPTQVPVSCKYEP